MTSAAHAEQRTFVYRSAPLTMGEFNVEFPREWVKAPPRDGYIVGMSARLVDTRGRAVTINDVMLHHVVFFQPSARNPPPPRAAASTRRRSTAQARRTRRCAATGIRVPLTPGRSLAHERDAHEPRAARSVARPGRVSRHGGVTRERLQGVVPFWVRANGCGSSTGATRSGATAGSGSTDTRTLRVESAVRRADRRRRWAPARRL